MMSHIRMFAFASEDSTLRSRSSAVWVTWVWASCVLRRWSVRTIRPMPITKIATGTTTRAP